MRLLKSKNTVTTVNRKKWNSISNLLKENKGQLGDLGGGNHFLDALQSYSNDYLYFLIHTGSRDESGLVDNLIDSPFAFDQEFGRVVNWASDNRSAIQHAIESEYGSLDIVFDLPHNTFEILEDESVIIRKGAIRLSSNEISAIPSHMTGDIALIKGTEKAGDILNSMSHGTGRKMSRSECKPFADSYNFDEMRKKIILPDCIDNSSLRTEGPYAYRELDDCLSLLKGYVEEIDRFSVIGYMGHL
jgi:RNA-splicing ligase RtcB